MSRAWTASSTPFSRDSTWNGKPAPSTYLHKQLDVTQALGSGLWALGSAVGTSDYRTTIVIPWLRLPRSGSVLSAGWAFSKIQVLVSVMDQSSPKMHWRMVP